MQPVIVVHGGAGNDFDDRLDAFRSGVERAAQVGWQVLAQGGSSVDAAVAAVQVLEDDPTYDAGHGSFLNANNEVEMDAMVMEGTRLGYGAVAGIQRVSHPVQVARLVMDHTPHSFFVGAGAEQFARQMGVPVCPMEELVAGSSTYLLRPEDRVFRPDEGPAGRDTVGAVAIDVDGCLATAVSTGGTAGKMAGRVGDSPIIGCGGYADNASGAAAATGHGEALMKVVFSKTACDFMACGLHPQRAAEQVLHLLESRVGPNSQGGIILLNPRGEVGCAYNTSHMVHACIRDAKLWMND
jgi:beta-aspartyl-peptidase (threonine type)